MSGLNRIRLHTAPENLDYTYCAGGELDGRQGGGEPGEAEAVPSVLRDGRLLHLLHQDHRLPSQDHSSLPGKGGTVSST